ncbi:MAG TPA: 50S ribosomal protein L10 [Armatimonadaceae bacterium]|jgi:large subunit ribosomal protein L10|nr:50S ribosomal protein L10 [Armatimonadaceae bacterium]
MAKKSGVSRQIKKKTVAVKHQVLEETGDLLGRAQAVVLADYRGLSVPQIGDLRKQLRDKDADFSVVKNTLFKRALAGEDGSIDPGLDAALNGPTAAVYALGDPVSVAKVVTDYIAANRNTPLSIKGGWVGGKFFDAKQVEQLSKVPPREVLISQMLGSFNAPITGFVGTLNGIISNFVFTLQAVADKRQSEGA